MRLVWWWWCLHACVPGAAFGHVLQDVCAHMFVCVSYTSMFLASSRGLPKTRARYTEVHLAVHRFMSAVAGTSLGCVCMCVIRHF